MCLGGLCNKMIDDTRIVASQTVWEWNFGSDLTVDKIMKSQSEARTKE